MSSDNPVGDFSKLIELLKSESKRVDYLFERLWPLVYKVEEIESKMSNGVAFKVPEEEPTEPEKELPPCPLCGNAPETHFDERYCEEEECGLFDHIFSSDDWDSMPRRDVILDEVIRGWENAQKCNLSMPDLVSSFTKYLNRMKKDG